MSTFAYAGHLIGEYDGSGIPIEETVWLGDTPVAVPRPKTGGFGVFYIWSENLGTPRLISDAANAVRWRWDNADPFGNNAPNENPSGLGAFNYNLRFPGEYYDAETAKHYNYYRDYDPSIARYVESDPVGLRGGFNTYSYALANPENYVDREGLFSMSGCCHDADQGISNQVSNACKQVASQVTDPRLRDCIMKRCESAKVSCDGLMCWLTGAVGLHLAGSQNITLCQTDNYVITKNEHWGCVAIHEWAHSCGWGHGQGAGIPGNSGSYAYHPCLGWAPTPPRPGPPSSGSK